MDVHVPRAVVLALRLRRVEVLTAQQDGSAKATSAEEWRGKIEYLPLS
jgi:hypothetical protein